MKFEFKNLKQLLVKSCNCKPIWNVT